MAIAGAWLASAQGTVPYSGALKQGTGIAGNGITASRDNGMGRNLTPGTGERTVDPALVDGFSDDDNFDYGEDSASTLWGYGVETGTSERPALGVDEGEGRVATFDDFPSYGPKKGGLPGGAGIRSRLKGAVAGIRAKETPSQPAAMGWDKEISFVEDAGISDPSQYIVQTSMVQRDQTLAGSQMPQGRASLYSAPIKSRITPMRVKFTGSDPGRHYDMMPKSQDAIIRPFWNRTAGLGYADYLESNAMYQSEPLVRTPPDNPYQGPDLGTTDAANAGFVSEDQTW